MNCILVPCVVSVVLMMSGCADEGGESASRPELPLVQGALAAQSSASESDSSEPSQAASVSADLPEIRKRGTLRAIMCYGATSYFIYKGEPMGYDYELMDRLVRSLDLDLQIVLARDMNQLFAMLGRGEGDIVAYGLTITQERVKKVAFTKAHHVTRQVLVQKKPDNWRDMKLHEIDRVLVRNQLDLIGKKVHVRKGSSYYTRLKSLSEEMGGDIDIVEVEGDVTTEMLIARVMAGEIAFTVADESLARINSAYYSDLDVETPVSFPQRVAWALRMDSPQLLSAVDEWLVAIDDEGLGPIIYSKYFKNRGAFKTRQKSDFMLKPEGGKISPYDDLFRTYAEKLGWDWRFLAAQAYQESRFDPKTKSWAGAVGLMQLMPKTGKAHGAERPEDPEDSLKAGTNYLQWLREQLGDMEDKGEKTKFVLAAYNAGKGHLDDARRLAEKQGKDPGKWDGEVEECMLALANQKYFNDSVVKYGYCRGEEPVKYVREILERYEHYKNFKE